VIVDSSAIVAASLEQTGGREILRAAADAVSVGVGAPTLVETSIVLSGRVGPRGRALVGRFLHETGAVVVSFGDDHWRVAVDAFQRFGKGRHPAALNLGDCLTYAVAKLADEPLLCTGDDFAQTDIELVVLGRDGLERP
jgi:ribonuclease VapC